MFCKCENYVKEKLKPAKRAKSYEQFGEHKRSFVEKKDFPKKLVCHFREPAFTCSKLTKETLEKGVKYVQS